MTTKSFGKRTPVDNGGDSENNSRSSPVLTRSQLKKQTASCQTTETNQKTQTEISSANQATSEAQTGTRDNEATQTAISPESENGRILAFQS